MCHVHENFRCIVLVDASKIDFSDPPFLNRFEKQMIMYPTKKFYSVFMYDSTKVRRCAHPKCSKGTFQTSRVDER